MDQRRAARFREQLPAQADQAARGNAKFHAYAPRAVVDHLGELAATRSERFHDDANEIFGAIDDQHFERLEAAAVFSVHHNFGLAGHELVAFAAHGFDQNGQLQFAAAEHAKSFGSVGILDADGDIGEQFLLQTVAQVTGGDPLAVPSGERRVIDREDHGQRRLINQQRLERRRIFRIGESLANLNALDAGNGDDISGGDGFSFVALQPTKGEELGNARGLEGAIELGDADLIAAAQGSLENASDGDAAEIIAVIEIGDLNLECLLRIARGRGDGIENGVEEEREVAGVISAGFAPLAVGDAGLGIGVEHGKIELVLGGVEVDEKAIDFVEDRGGAGVGTVDFVQNDDGRQLGLQGLLQDVTRLGQGAFAGIHQQEDAIDHAEGALDFAAKVAVARRIHDIDARAATEKGGVLGQDGDTALAFEFVGIHHAFGDFLVNAEDAALAEHGVNERGFAVVHVRDDGDIADGVIHKLDGLL